MFGLENLAPKFLVPSKRINVLYEPSEFYNYLCNRIRTAKSRVYLASLYLGKSEQELIDVIADALRKNEELKVYVLVDGLRGTREAPKTCSASLLAPLAAQFPSQVRISLYRTPKLGWLKSMLLPKRIIEGVGLQHMKLYGCDDEIVLSGANLSQDYFTNRQDRYMSIKDPKVANWFYKVQTAVSDLSYTLYPANNEQKFELEAPSFKQRRAARAQLTQLLKPAVENASADTVTGLGEDMAMTAVYPVAQFTPLRLGNEHSVMQRIFMKARSPQYDWLLTAGYFNVQPQLADELSQSENGEIIVAAPEANGFYKSKGISGKLPHFYSVLTRDFLAKIPPASGLVVREWKRGIVNTPGGWSYHAKGIWLWKKDQQEKLPLLTYIGSSNFTRRGYKYDLECGAVLVPQGSAKQPIRGDPLSEKLAAEKARLLGDARAQLTLKSLKPNVTLKDRLLLLLLGDRL